jgi:hypothetical protein
MTSMVPSLSHKYGGRASEVGLLREIGLLAMLLLYIFGWKLWGAIDLGAIASVGLAIYALLRGYRVRLPTPIIAALGILTCTALYSVGLTVITQATDVDMAGRLIRALVNLLGGIGLGTVYLRLYGEAAGRRCARDVFVVIGFHALLMLSMYRNPELRELIYRVTDAQRYVNLNFPFLQGYRVSGLTYGLSTTSALQACGLLLLPSVLSGVAGWRKLIVLCFALLVIASVFISGRAGLVVTFVFLFASVLWWLMRLRGRALAILGVMTATIGGLAMIVGIFRDPALNRVWDDEQLLYTARHAGEVLTLFLEPEESTGARGLKGMFFLPSDLVTLMFGASVWDRELLGISTDAGWVRTWFALGAIGILLHVALVGSLVWASIGSWRRDRALALGVLGVIVVVTLMNFKEVMFLTRNSIAVLFLLAYLVALRLDPLGHHSRDTTAVEGRNDS